MRGRPLQFAVSPTSPLRLVAPHQLRASGGADAHVKDTTMTTKKKTEPTKQPPKAPDSLTKTSKKSDI
jgi:hypothetical protein